MLTMTIKEKCADAKRSFLTRFSKPLAVAVSSGSAIAALAVTASADAYTPETFTASQLDGIFTSLNTQFNVAFVLGVVGAIIAACSALVAMWWGARKGVRMLMSAFKRGKLRI